MSNLNLPLSTKCIKYLLFIFNLLFVITGIILLCIGVTIHGVYGQFSHFLNNGGYLSTSAFLIAIGLIIFVISFFGCCGAVKENFCMTLTFTTLLIVVFIFEFAAGISGYVLRDNTVQLLKNSINSTMYEYLINNESAKVIDKMQTTFECCGVSNATEWYKIIGNETVPLSCCDVTGGINVICDNTSDRFFNDTCIHAFGNYIQGHAVTIGGVALGIAFVQLIGIAFSCHLSKQIKQYHNL